MKKYNYIIILVISVLLIDLNITNGQENNDDANAWLNVGDGLSYTSKNNRNKGSGFEINFAINYCYNKNYFKLGWLKHSEFFFSSGENETDLGKFAFLYGRRIYKGLYMYSGISHLKGYLSSGNYETNTVSSFSIPFECEIILFQNKYFGFGCNLFSDFVINKFSMYGFGFIVRYGSTDK